MANKKMGAYTKMFTFTSSLLPLCSCLASVCLYLIKNFQLFKHTSILSSAFFN